MVEGVEVIGAGSLKEVIGLLNGEREMTPAVPADGEPFGAESGRYEEDFADVKGQTHVKRALEIAAAGGHNVLMIGAPGSGKTMLAPQDADHPAAAVARRGAGDHQDTLRGRGIRRRAVCWRGGPSGRRTTTISQAALIGGGQSPRPGEVSLAHNGVLFLDEAARIRAQRAGGAAAAAGGEEGDRLAGEIQCGISRQLYAGGGDEPCPCGYYNHPAKECVCSPGSVHRYMSRISGPLMDRIDLHVEVTPVPAAELSAAAPGEPSAAVRERVVRAREVQAARFAGTEGVHTNAMMNAAMLREYCRPDAASAALLERAMERLSLSARAYDRILKVARTIADLAGRETIAAADVAEAINYRSLDRGNWGAVKGGRKGGEREEFVILQAACLGMLSGVEAGTRFSDRWVLGPPGTAAGGDAAVGPLSCRGLRAVGLAGCRVFGPGRRGSAGGPLSYRGLRAFGGGVERY